MLSRIAVISYHSSPLLEPGSGDSGGMTIYVRHLAEALARLGVHTDVYTRWTSDVPRIVEMSPAVRVISIDAGPPGPAPKQELARHIPEFTAGIRAFAASQRLRYEIVHSHYWQSGLAATGLAAMWDAPLVHSHHTLGRVKNRYLAPGDLPEPQSRLDGEAEVIAAADVLIASTDDEWDHLACLYGAPHDRLKTIHPGVDHNQFRPTDRRAARSELGIEDELVVLYAGRIQRLKGVDLAIAAVGQLVSALERPVAFTIVGGASGPEGDAELARLQRLVTSLGLDGVVRFVGPQPHARLPIFYNAADVVVVPSHSESFGLAALEAHACGTPVVATAVGGLSHIVRDGHSGFLVDSRDASVFAGRLKTMLGDEDLIHRFRVEAVAAARGFSWERTAATFEELYDCLASRRVPHLCTC